MKNIIHEQLKTIDNLLEIDFVSIRQACKRYIEIYDLINDDENLTLKDKLYKMSSLGITGDLNNHVLIGHNRIEILISYIHDMTLLKSDEEE